MKQLKKSYRFLRTERGINIKLYSSEKRVQLNREDKERYEYFQNIFKDINSATTVEELETKLSLNMGKLVKDTSSIQDAFHSRNILITFLLYGSLMNVLDIDIKDLIVDKTIRLFRKI